MAHKALNLGNKVSISICLFNFILFNLFSDVKSQIKFIEFYEKCKKDHKIFLAFDRGDYYSIHGKDIDIAMKTTLKSSIIPKMMTPSEDMQLKYASLNTKLFERLIRELLLVQFYRVEVYSSKQGSKDEYSLEYHGSPGNLWQFENLLFSGDAEIFSNFLVSIQLTSVNKLNVSSQ